MVLSRRPVTLCSIRETSLTVGACSKNDRIFRRWRRGRGAECRGVFQGPIGILELKRIRSCCTVSGDRDSHREVPFIAIASRTIPIFLGCVPGVPRARLTGDRWRPETPSSRIILRRPGARPGTPGRLADLSPTAYMAALSRLPDSNSRQRRAIRQLAEVRRPFLGRADGSESVACIIFHERDEIVSRGVGRALSRRTRPPPRARMALYRPAPRCEKRGRGEVGRFGPASPRKILPCIHTIRSKLV